ncbi:PREDICTED: uncharacterized protein LOC105152413 isoform X2 [Acromyrmex echinatior]|uniref:uncharacterized protein LOC105152413 isoform X2 n=1 Tax=Acromyrmex echinatior TaxID=103372 RepID=UPI000580CD5E|nr:PREDICTED: uncharacterized protein LOC105152413 isoform X2 [Acromyrmex echinatior]
MKIEWKNERGGSPRTYHATVKQPKNQSGYISSTAVHWQPLALFGCRACLGSLISNRIISGARATGMSHGARENQNGKRKRKR